MAVGESVLSLKSRNSRGGLMRYRTRVNPKLQVAGGHSTQLLQYETNKQSTKVTGTFVLTSATTWSLQSGCVAIQGYAVLKRYNPAKRWGKASRQEPLLRRKLESLRDNQNQNLSGVLIRHRPTHRPAQVVLPYLRSEQAGADRAFAPAPTSA